MSESTIRHMVRTALEEHGTDLGLFADERIRSFFVVVKTLVHDCFYSLYDTVTRDYASPADRQHRLNRGLAYIANDSNHNMGADEVTRALQEFPTVQQEYERAMVRFAQFMVPQRDPGMKIEIPSFASFLMKLYSRVATSADVKSGRFFNMTYLEKDIFLKDMFRVTMNACTLLRPSGSTTTTSTTTNNTTSRSSTSHASSAARSQSQLVSNAVMHAVTPDAESTTVPSAKFCNKIMPSDSVSNIRAEQEWDNENSSLISDTTQFSLRKYKKQLEERQKEKGQVAPVKPFVTPSIARRKKSEPVAGGETKTISGFFDNSSNVGEGAASDFAGLSTLSRQ